ncbi:hypothetical protein Asp14428_33090 [Actinoplanes sp. NBRC 14428]|nr:hypothetical protein Asp14428_33090 [Actinoplanes sp. NBRC 14428]
MQQLMPQESPHRLQLLTTAIRQRRRRAEIAPASRYPRLGDAGLVSRARRARRRAVSGSVSYRVHWGRRN